MNGQDLDIVDAKFVKPKKIVWENLKFDSNSTSYILNTENLKGKYRNEDLNDAPSKLAIGDCGPLNYAKGKTKSTLQLTQSSGIGALGVILGVALAIGAGSSGGSGTSSHN